MEEDEEISSTKGRTRRKKGHRRFKFSTGVRRKRKERQTGKKPPKSCGTEKNQNERKPQLIGQQRIGERMMTRSLRFGWVTGGREKKD